MKIISLDEQVAAPIFALAYGASGTGKTHLAGTLGQLGKVLIIDIDKGTDTLRYAPELKKLKVQDNITVVSFDAFEDLDQAYKLVRSNKPSDWNKAFKLSGDDALTEPFDWIVWDTWSEIQWAMMEKIRSGKSELSGNGKLAFRDNIQIKHWGMMTDLNKLSIESLRACPVNQLFTMQEKLDKDEISGLVYGGPAIHGKLVQEIPAYFGVVVHTYTDLTGTHCATTISKGRWPAKTRLGVGKDLKGPTIKSLLDL